MGACQGSRLGTQDDLVRELSSLFVASMAPYGLALQRLTHLQRDLIGAEGGDRGEDLLTRGAATSRATGGGRTACSWHVPRLARFSGDPDGAGACCPTGWPKERAGLQGLQTLQGVPCEG